MFSAEVFPAKHVFPPKNGPVPSRRKGYDQITNSKLTARIETIPQIQNGTLTPLDTENILKQCGQTVGADRGRNRPPFGHSEDNDNE